MSGCWSSGSAGVVYNDGLMARSERLYIYIYIRGLGLEFSDNLLDKI